MTRGPGLPTRGDAAGHDLDNPSHGPDIGRQPREGY